MNKQIVAMAAVGLLAGACGPDAPDQHDMQPQANQPAARQDAADRTATQEGRVPPVPLPGGSTTPDGAWRHVGMYCKLCRRLQELHDRATRGDDG